MKASRLAASGALALLATTGITRQSVGLPFYPHAYQGNQGTLTDAEVEARAKLHREQIKGNRRKKRKPTPSPSTGT